MERNNKFIHRRAALAGAVLTCVQLAGCWGGGDDGDNGVQQAQPKSCTDLKGMTIAASSIGLPTSAT